MQQFPARIRADGSGFMANFRDIPEARTWAATRQEVIEMAQDALVTAMDFYFEDGRPVPAPSEPKRGDVLIGLPASVAAKVLLLNEMAAGNVGPSELARRLGTTPQTVNRIVDLKHPTKIDTIGEALAVLGKRLVLAVA